MTNNDVLRSLRFALELTPADLCAYLREAGADVPLAELAALLKDDGEPGFVALPDALLERLLDGMITSHRGRREGPHAPADAPERLSNNRILRALRIAFALRDTDILAFMDSAGRTVSKAELSALFRRPDHRNYQPCGDQFLRVFLRGLGVWRRQARGH